MPRKIAPHLNEQSDALPTDYVAAFELPEGIERLLPAETPAVYISDTVQRIRYALGEYEWECKAGPHRYSRAEASKALRDLLRRGSFDHLSLTELNQRAYNLLFDCLDDNAAQRWMLLGGDVMPRDAVFEKATKRALEMNHGLKGPEASIPLAILVARLSHIYEVATGKNVTDHTKARDLAYTQTAQTHAGKFVTAVITAAFDDIPPTRINRELRSFVANRPAPF